MAFFQDEDYLELNGNALGKMGLEHIGEWHSHHKLGKHDASHTHTRTHTHGISTHMNGDESVCFYQPK